MGKRKNLVVDLAKDNIYSNNEKPKEVYKPSKFEKVINYLLCRSDLANQELSVKPVPFVQLFRYAERIDVVLLIIGSILAAISGILQTAQEVIVGHLTNTMIVYNTTSDEFYDKAMFDVWLLGGLGVFALFTHFVQYMSFQYCCVRITSKIKQEYIRSILRQNAEWLDRNHSGVLTTKLHDNIERINEGIGDKLGVLIRGIVMFTSGIGFSFYYDWRLTLSIIGIGPLCCICMSLMSRSSDSFAAKEFDGLGKAGSIAEEALMGVRTVQAFNGQEEMAEKYTTQLGQGRMFAVRKGFWEGVFGGLLFFFMFLFCGIGTYYGALLLYWRVIDNPGTVFIVITSTLMGAYFLGLISPHLMVVLNARVAAATVYEIIDRVPEIDAYSSAGRKIEKVEGKILFDNVTFRYATRKDTTVLDGFSLTIEPGTSVALVGHSGCGKSTCISLLERLYEQEAGRVLIDGVDIRELNIGWLRKVVGIVQQEPVIFHDTITNNLLIGNPDAMQQDIVEACKMANAHDFIMKLPRGYDTMIGDGGVQLSGGQKQRIAIARTLIRDPKILLLDEATSALDAHSESVVQSALGKASKGRTTVVVAHRLSTIREADKIVFLENGVIVECGNHEELVKFGGRYAKLVESQKFKDSDGAENGEHRHRYSRQSSTKSYESRKSVDLDSCSSDETLTDLSEIQHNIPENEAITTGYMDIIRNAHGNYWYLITGTIFAVIRGSELALWSVMFGYMFHAFTLPMDQMMDVVFLIFLVYGLLGLLVFATQVASTTLFSIVAENLCLKFRVEALKNLLHQDAAFYDNPAHTPGKLITRLATDAPNVKAVMDSRMLNFISSANSVWMNLIFGYYYSWQISLVGTMLLIAFALFIIGIASLIAKENLKQIKQDEAGKISIEIIENVKTIQLLTGSSRFLDCYANAIHSQNRSVTINATLNSINSSMAQTFMFFSMFICYAAGTPLIYHEIVDATSAYRAINAMMMGSVGVMNSSHNFQEFIKAKTAAGMLFKLIYQKPNTGDVMEGSNNEMKGNVSFDSVKFCYPQRPMHEVMSNLCLPIKSGQSIALVGPSGAGKSTCIAMLERFYDVSGGALCIDGEDIRNMSLHNLRTQMALVGQEPRLFAGTIKENVCFGLKNVPMEQVNHALELANATKFLANLPMGMDTEVGEKGSQLSGGQKQRIAIARALVRNPKILLLDEATSALDSESERAVQQALDRAREGRTCITIAHRLSSIQNADVIFYIDNGIVQEFGSHSYLMTKRGKYYGLTRKQDLTA